MNLHQEHHFEREICAHLAAGAGLYTGGDAAHHDSQLGSFRCTLVESKAGVSEA